jgi:hypothetical protein
LARFSGRAVSEDPAEILSFSNGRFTGTLRRGSGLLALSPLDISVHFLWLVSLRIALLLLSAVLIGAIALDFGAWTRTQAFVGPFAADTSGARLYFVPIGTMLPLRSLMDSGGDAAGRPARSSLRLELNGTELGPPHMLHADLRSGHASGYSHWGEEVLFNLPEGIANDKTTALRATYSVHLRTFPYRLVLGCWLLVLALNLIDLRAVAKLLDGAGAQRTLQSRVRAAARSMFQPARVTGGVLFCVFFFLAFQLRQRDLEFLIESDFNWPLIEAWRAFLTTLDPGRLPAPYPHVYLDGQFIVYALADQGLRWLAGPAPSLLAHFPNNLSYPLEAAMLTNIFAYAAACTIFFAATYRLIGRVSVAAPLAIGLFLAPQMVDIPVVRVDYLISLPLMIVFYCSCVLALGQERRRHSLALGAALALIATIKINGLFFGVFPAFAAIASFRFDRGRIAKLVNFVKVSLAAFAIVFIPLMGRYIYYLSVPEIIRNYSMTAEILKEWEPLLTGPTFYYNLDLMLRAGWPFATLYLLCALVTLILAVWQRRGPPIFLSLCFVGLSIAGVFAPKYPRGGYHLLPVAFAMIALTVDALVRWPERRNGKIALAMAAGVAVAATLITSFARYQVVVAKRENEPIGLEHLKRAPRDWLQSHVAAGTTVCIQTYSGWTLPPLDRFKVVNGPMGLPFLDSTALARTLPPDLDSLAKQCPLIVTSDWHRAFYRDFMARASQETTDKWDSFFERLDDRYPPVIFSSPVAIEPSQSFSSPAAVFIKSVSVNDLRAE